MSSLWNEGVNMNDILFRAKAINRKEVFEYRTSYKNGDMFCKNCGRELKCSNNVLCSCPPQYEYYCGHCNEKYTSTEKCPRIDYVLKKKGQWIYIQDQDAWECSECKDAFILFEGTPKDNNYNHCPNCGIEMEM